MSTKRVLIVDDEAPIRELLARLKAVLKRRQRPLTAEQGATDKGQNSLLLFAPAQSAFLPGTCRGAPRLFT
jgi:hypothetical protein